MGFGLFNRKPDAKGFDPNKIKKLTSAEVIAKLKKEELDALDETPTGVFRGFDEEEE